MSDTPRIAETLFCRNMLGPSFGHFASSVTGLVLIEKLVLEYVFPPWAPAAKALEASFGRTLFCVYAALIFASVVFWGLGFLMALPACFDVKMGKIQPNKSLSLKALFSALPLVAFNFVLGVLLYALVMAKCLPDSSFDFTQLPSTTSLVRDVIVWMCVQEVVFFYVHKFFHENKRAYAAIHKLHHTWTAPVSVIAIYCHPVEHLVANMSPLVIGPLLCKSHCVAISTFILAGLAHTLAVHSGYWFCDDNGMHDEHHAKFTVNYGVTGVLDSWYGTYRLPVGAVGKQSGAAPAAKKD